LAPRLSHSISSHGCVPDAHAVALVTEKVSDSVRQELAAAGWSVTSVQTITSVHPSVVEDRWRDNYSKLHSFALLQYRAVMFIDADAIVLGDLQASAPLSKHTLQRKRSAAFNATPPSRALIQPAFACTAALCAVVDVWLPVFFNTGFMVLTPNITVRLRRNCGARPRCRARTFTPCLTAVP
jgi:hypothetical protein